MCIDVLLQNVLLEFPNIQVYPPAIALVFMAESSPKPLTWLKRTGSTKHQDEKP